MGCFAGKFQLDFENHGMTHEVQPVHERNGACFIASFIQLSINLHGLLHILSWQGVDYVAVAI